MTTTETTPDLDILIRIEKLLAQSEDPSCTTPEREAFQDKAFQLMERHRIDRSQVGGHLAKDDVIETQIVGEFNGIYGGVRIDIASAVATANDIQIFWNGHQNLRTLKAYGFKSDIDRAIPLINRLLADADLRVKLLEKSYDMKDTIRQRRGFYSGYADAIYFRLLAARDAAEKQANDDGVDIASTALVLVDRARQVNESLRASMYIRKAGGTKPTGADGYDHGNMAGRNADLSNRNAVGSRKALTS
jgi:hypothetical protein